MSKKLEKSSSSAGRDVLAHEATRALEAQNIRVHVGQYTALDELAAAHGIQKVFSPSHAAEREQEELPNAEETADSFDKFMLQKSEANQESAMISCLYLLRELCLLPRKRNIVTPTTRPRKRHDLVSVSETIESFVYY